MALGWHHVSRRPSIPRAAVNSYWRRLCMKYRPNSLFLKCLEGKAMKELQSPKMNNIFKCVQNAFKLYYLCYCHYDYYYNIITIMITITILLLAFCVFWWRQMGLTDLLTMHSVNLSHIWVFNMLIYVTCSIAVFKNIVGDRW